MAGAREFAREDPVMQFSMLQGVNVTLSKEEWKKLNMEYIIAKDLSNTDVLDLIREKSIQSGEGYSYELPLRGPSQVTYVTSLKQLCLERGKTVICSFGDPKTGDRALIVSAVLSIVQDALLDKIPIDCRAVFYRDIDLFVDQDISDEALYDVCCLLGVSRHCLNVTASPKGVFTGPITLRMNGMLGEYDIACQMNCMEGCMVPITPGEIKEIVFTGKEPIRFILVVEKKPYSITW